MGVRALRGGAWVWQDGGVKTHLVTGANRGLGLEFARQLIARGDRVFAACRMPGEADDLLALVGEAGPDRLKLVRLDVLNEDSITGLGDDVAGKVERLDSLINNAGIYGPRGEDQRLGGVTQSVGREIFTVNAIGPLLVTKALRPLLGDGSVVMHVTSGYGSIDRADDEVPYLYGASKAAVNMIGRIMAAELAGAGVVVVNANPGWTATDMGGYHGQQSAADSVRGMIAHVLDPASPERSGRVWNHDGQEIPF